MSSDEEELETPSVPFGGLQQHSQNYKSYISGLKSGKSSGISGLLGFAQDLLPEEDLQVYEDGKAGPQVGTSIVKEEAASNALVEAVAGFRELCRTAQENTREVIGVLYEGGRKKLLLSDYSLIDAPDEIPVEQHSADTLAESPPLPGGDLQKLSVCMQNGLWLWDVHLHGDTVESIFMADGTSIWKTVHAQVYVIIEEKQQYQRIPNVEIVASVRVHPSTGTITYESLDGTRTALLMNNGFRVEQEYDEQGVLACFVTPPSRDGEKQKKMRVTDVRINAASGDVTFNDPEQGLTVTLKSYALS